MACAIVPLLLLGITACSTFQASLATKEEVTASAKRIVAKRESWTGQVHYDVRQEYDGSWRVSVNQLEPPHANHPCLLFVPGTSRYLVFTRTGKLVSYNRNP